MVTLGSWHTGALRVMRWSALVGRRIETVTLDYRPWSDAGDWWCPAITITSENTGVVLGLGEVGSDGDLAPSADNVVALRYPSDASFPILRSHA
ncbi:hypothetical protein D1825_14155 [Cellulomonas rhizosphaerae]|uniref:Uncharacterized protein n=1 Tax=Cellulomonas rhizosphaerae TaxID=2293719 RepID=A0A413RJ04_9CELL|nr:hypothetical protein D1825_14155 [Cellulomonas rhizosphaerae]